MPIYNEEPYGHPPIGEKNRRDGDSALGTRKHEVISVSKRQAPSQYRGREAIEQWHLEALTDTGKTFLVGIRHSSAEADTHILELEDKYGL